MFGIMKKIVLGVVFKDKAKLSKNELVRNLLNTLITDLIENSQNQIIKEEIKNIEHVYKKNFNVINFSNDVNNGLKEIRDFLKLKMRRNYKYQ